MKHERPRVERSTSDRLRDLLNPPRTDISAIEAELAGMRAAWAAKAEAARREVASRLSESIRQVVMDLALTGPTGVLARNLVAKHV